MIVLDCNALRSDGLGPSTNATLLRGLSQECGHPLAVPQLVLDEFMAGYRRNVQEALDGSDRDRMLALVPSWVGRADVARGSSDALPTLRTATSAREEVVRNRFAVLPSPEGAAAEGHQRELNRVPPAGTGREGRDVVIWLTAVDKAREIAPSKLFFVSRDKAFSDQGKSRLRVELTAEAPRNFRFLRTVESLIERLSCATDVDSSVASGRDVLHVIEQTATDGYMNGNHDLRRDLWGWEPTGQGILASGLQVAAVPLEGSSPSVDARSLGTTRLTAIDAVYQLNLEWPGVARESVSVRLGVLVRHEEDELASVRVVAHSPIRAEGH